MILANVKINGKAVLAPMAGFTDRPFRWLCKQFGAALVFTEMVSADGLLENNRRSREYLFFEEDERPISVQLFGSDPAIIAEAVCLVEPLHPDFVDLNFGCPVKKVVRQGAGAALLADLRQLGRICSSAVQASSIPVTVKIRTGWHSEIASEVAKVLADSGASAITIHARTQRAKFSGSADWTVIERVKNAVSIPVIGNGDIHSDLDAKLMLDQTGCDLVMVGRGALGNPFIFKQINHYLRHGERIDLPTIEERILTCMCHLNRVRRTSPSTYTLQRMRKHIGYYLKGAPNARGLRREIFSYNSPQQVRSRLVSYLREIELTTEPLVPTNLATG